MFRITLKFILLEVEHLILPLLRNLNRYLILSLTWLNTWLSSQFIIISFLREYTYSQGCCPSSHVCTTWLCLSCHVEWTKGVPLIQAGPIRFFPPMNLKLRIWPSKSQLVFWRENRLSGAGICSPFAQTFTEKHQNLVFRGKRNIYLELSTCWLLLP